MLYLGLVISFMDATTAMMCKVMISKVVKPDEESQEINTLNTLNII